MHTSLCEAWVSTSNYKDSNCEIHLPDLKSLLVNRLMLR